MTLKEKLSYDQFYKHFIEENLTIKEIADLYDSSTTQVTRLNHEYKIMKSKEKILECRKRLFIEKYGVENPMNIDEFKNKMNTTKKENNKPVKKHIYTEEEKQAIQTKMKQTCLERYGVENAGWTKESQEKILKTNLAKYGTINPMQNKEIQAKAKQSCLNKYGVTTTALDPETRQKMNESRRKTLDSKIGSQQYLENIYKSRDIPEEYYEILKDKDSFIKWINDTFPDGCSNYDIRQQIHFTEATIAKYIRKYDLYENIIIPKSRSNYEKEIIEYLKSLGIVNIITNDRTIINPYEIDIYLPEYKLAIEFNGTYWHSSLFADKTYHQQKSLMAEKQNIKLIHIYEYEWLEYPDKIQSLLKIALGKVDNKIYARNCEIKLINNETAKPFNNKNHIQGHRNAQITYGLYYEGNLMQLMSFSKHSKYEWEIIRGCPGSNNVVVGGISKLFQHFVKENNPAQVFSYCDFNKFDGHGYETIGMKYIGLTGPDMKYVIGKNKVMNRNPKKYNKNKNNIKLYGAGSKKYLWKKEVE